MKKYFILLLIPLLAACGNKNGKGEVQIGAPETQSSAEEQSFDSSLIEPKSDTNTNKKKNVEDESKEKDKEEKTKESDKDSNEQQETSKENEDEDMVKPDGVVMDYKEELVPTKDSEGKEMQPQSIVKTESINITDALLQDWYNKYISKGEASIYIIEYADKPGYGVYGNIESIFKDVKLEKWPDGSYKDSRSNDKGNPDIFMIEDGKVEFYQ